MEGLNKRFTLSNQEIMEAVDEGAATYMALAGKRAASEKTFKIILEAYLLCFQDAYGADGNCTLRIKREFAQIKISIYNKGPAMNPISTEDSLPDEVDFIESLTHKFGIVSKYEYLTKNGGYNVVSYYAEKKPLKNKMLIYILTAIALAVLMFFLTGLLPESTQEIIYTGITQPIFNKMTAIITTVASWLVLFAVITGIGGMGDTSKVGKLGKMIFGEMGKSYLVESILLGIGGGIFYMTTVSSNTATDNPFAQIIQLVLDIIPSNVVQPFVDDNALQIIVIAIFAGVVLLQIGKKLEYLPKVCFEISDLVNQMMLIICKLLPVLVFFGIYNMLLSGELAKIISVYKMILLFFGICFVFVLLLTLRAKHITGLSFATMFKKQKDPFIITLTTSSQVAAIPENLKTFKDGFGIDERFANFALPLCVVTYMPCGAVFLGLVGFSLASIAGIVIDLSIVIKVVLVCCIVAIAAPPIPGSALAVMPIIFTACGIPGDLYPLAIVLGTIIGYLLPAFNCYCLQLKILISAYRLDLVDKSKCA